MKLKNSFLIAKIFRELGNFHLVRGANNTLSLDLNTLIGGTKKELAINSKHVYAETSYFEAHSGIHPDSITKTLVAEQKGFLYGKFETNVTVLKMVWFIPQIKSDNIKASPWGNRCFL